MKTMKKQVTGEFWFPIDKDYVETCDGGDYLRVLSSLRFNSGLDNDKLDRLIELLEMYRDYHNDEELNAIFQLGNTHCSIEFRQGFKDWERFSKSTAVLSRDGKFVATGGMLDNVVFLDVDDDIEVRPLAAGEIVDREAAKYLVREMVMEHKERLFPTREISKMLMIVPAAFSTQEFDLLREAVQEAGVKDVRFIYRPLAEAICLGHDIYEPEARMIVHCGRGATEISVIAFGGIVTSKTLPFPGNLFTQNLCKYLLDKYNVIVDEETAERAKVEIISCITAKKFPNPTMEMSGVTPGTNRSVTFAINHALVEWALDELSETIVQAVLEVLGSIPPEMAYDFVCKTKRIVLSGGSVLINLDTHIKNAVREHYSKGVVTDAEGKRVLDQQPLSDFDVIEERRPLKPNPFLELMHFDRFDFLIK